MKPACYDLEPKKRPRQGRSQATWDAMLDAAAQLLCERGYHGLTTNHVAELSGVSIGTVYEYFPGKDALVAEVVERCIRKQLAGMLAIAQEIIPLPGREGVRYAVDAAYRLLLRDKALIRVMLFEVPFTRELESFQNLGSMLLRVAVTSNREAAPHYRVFASPASLFLMNTLMGGTLLQVVLGPPAGVSVEEILGELTERLIEWTVAE